MRILFFTSGDCSDPASRYRGYFFANELRKYGFFTLVYPSKSSKKKLRIRRAFDYSMDLLKKVKLILTSEIDDVFYIQRSIRGSVPSILTSLFIVISKCLLKRKIIYDFDDALFLSEPWATKISVKFCDTVIVGSHFLKEYAEKYNQRTFLLPTSVYTNEQEIVKKRNKKENVVIGWIGLPINLRYLRLLIEPLNFLGKKYNIEFRIVGARSYGDYERYSPLFSKFSGVKLKLIPWSLETEWKELSEFDIGVMPLFNIDFERGKCGFKIIQYMVLGIPPVASNVGENKYIIKEGINGFLCDEENEWIEKLSLLIESEELRIRIGINGRKTVEEKYSLEKNGRVLANIITSLL